MAPGSDNPWDSAVEGTFSSQAIEWARRFPDEVMVTADTTHGRAVYCQRDGRWGWVVFKARPPADEGVIVGRDAVDMDTVHVSRKEAGRRVTAKWFADLMRRTEAARLADAQARAAELDAADG